jgi:tRNA pseudouridine38-40 synthase
VGAGRTDSGVHAVGQVVSTAEAPDDVDFDRARSALNGMCGPSISVRECRRVADEFHARFSARSRTYIYALLVDDIVDPWLSKTALWHPGDLDVSAMQEAAGHLVGQHDFRSFGRPPEPDAATERILYDLDCSSDGRIVRIRARANAFLQQMVRSLVGTLVQVGERRRSPGEMGEILEARDRAAAGPVSPPHGLCLVSVEYEDGWSGPKPVPRSPEPGFDPAE